MKKIISIVIGLVVVISAMVLIRSQRAHKMEVAEPELQSGTIEYKQNTEVLQAARRSEPGATESEQSVDKALLKYSSAVKMLLGLDGKQHNYNDCNQALRELYTSLSDSDVKALQGFLEEKPENFAHMRPIEFNALKNDALDMLVRREEFPEGLSAQLVEMAFDPLNDSMWREYCVQFMPSVYERLATDGLTTKGTEDHKGNVSITSESSSGAGDEERDVGVNELSVVRDALFSALDVREAAIAGTALIGLEELSREHAEFDREAIVSKAVEIASDESAISENRLTALRLAAMEGGEQIADVARSLAQTGETVLLRSAAIVTLGEIGSTDDRELLESYVLAGNRQIVSAAKMALAKMDAR